MNKDEFLKTRTCVLKVNIHCDGCKKKVKKTLQKIDGVYTMKIDSEQGKVTVSGNVDPATLIKKLIKKGKHAEIWGASKPHDNFQNQLNNQFKNLMIDNGKGENNKGDIKKGGDDKPKGGGQDPLKLLQQLQQMKGFQDLKPLPLNKDHNQKSDKLNLPEDEDLSDDEFEDDDDYDDDNEYDDDDEFEDDVEDVPLKKMKPVSGNGHGGSFMSNLLMNSQNLIKAGGNNGGNGGGNGKKGGGGESDGGANGGKKGGGKGGGAHPNDSKNGGGGGGQNNRNDNHGGSGATNGKIFMPNGAKKNGGMIDQTRGMPNMMSMNLPIGQMGNTPTRPIGSLPAVQGSPALNASTGGGAGYFHGGGPEHMAGNPYQQQQQLVAMTMNQRRANGNENFQPMIYARPPPAVNYMPSYLPYPYPPPPGEQIDEYSMFSDENTSGCNIM